MPSVASVLTSVPPRAKRGSSPWKTASGDASPPSKSSGLCGPRVPTPRPSTKIRRTDIVWISSIRGKRKASRRERGQDAGAPGDALDAAARVSAIVSEQFEISASYISAFVQRFGGRMFTVKNLRVCAVAFMLLTFGLKFPAAHAQKVAAQPTESRPYFYEPSISPDRKEIAFVSGGDIWTVPADGGEARLLVSHPATESRPLYSPDGRRLAFISTRTGNGDIYVLDFASGDLKRLTFDDGYEQLDSWSYDGKWIYFSSTARDISASNDIYRVSAEGGTPMQVSADRYANEWSAAPAPNGTDLAFVGKGYVQWWRHGHTHIDESVIMLMHNHSTSGYERLTDGDAKEVWPMWGDGGKSLYFMSDRSGAENIWKLTPGGEARQLTKFTDGRVLWPSISYDGRAIVFERGFGVWKLDTESGRAGEVRIARRGVPAGPAFERGGREIRALNMETRQERVVATGALQRPPLNPDRPFVWSPDSRWIAYLPVGQKLFRNVFVARVEGDGKSEPVSFLANGGSDTVAWSPDGTFILFDTGQRTEPGQLARVDLIPRTPRFREDQFRDLFKEETPKNVSPTLRRQENNPQSPVPPPGTPPQTPTPTPTQTPTPSPTETATPAQTPTPSRTPQPATVAPGGAKPPDKPVEIVFDGIRRRLSLLPVGVDVFYQTISPDGKWILMIAGAENETNLYLFSLDELSREPSVARQLTSTPGFKTDAQFSPDSQQVFYVENGRIQIAPLDQRQPPRSLAVAAAMEVEFAREKTEVFEQGWEYMRDNSYDPNFHAADWQAVHDQLLPYVEGAGTPDEVRRLMRLMVGELNASHLGVSLPFGTTQVTTGRLGLDFDREEYERTGRLRVAQVIPLGPSALARDTASPDKTRAVKVGEYLLAVDGKQLDARTNLEDLLNYKIGRRITLAVASSPEGAGVLELDVRPVNLATEKGLRYCKWVDEKRAYVERVSAGRVGYVHMIDMSSASLSQLYVDLDAENQSKEAVVVDIRHNDGGFVNVYAVDVLARRSYLRMTPRGFAPAPARTALGQRALELPTALVTDQYSLSDAEDFTEGYRSLRLGKVVGEPTAGWIIHTSGVSLLEGTVFRLPYVRIETAEGVEMERNPRPVDVPVARPVGESYTDHDSQLDAAVRELLRQR